MNKNLITGKVSEMLTFLKTTDKKLYAYFKKIKTSIKDIPVEEAKMAEKKLIDVANLPDGTPAYFIWNPEKKILVFPFSRFWKVKEVSNFPFCDILVKALIHETSPNFNSVSLINEIRIQNFKVDSNFTKNAKFFSAKTKTLMKRISKDSSDITKINNLMKSFRENIF